MLSSKTQLGEDNFLNVFNTHMQASYYDAPSDSSDMARAKQVNEIAAFVKEKVYGREKRYPALIMGDFNLDSRTHKNEGQHSLDYLRMMDVFLRELNSEVDGYFVRDLLYESTQEHPITYGDVTEQESGIIIPKETVLTHVPDHCCSLSIDYSFFLGPIGDSNIRHVGSKVEPFECEENEAGPCTHLSDHYGIITNLEIGKEQENFENMN